MPRIKRYIQTGYTTVNNELLRDQTLSLTDRGLLVTMLSLPDGWNITGRGLAKILPDGRDRVYASLSRLEDHGYLRREQIKINGRFNDEEYQFCDLPVFKEENAQLAILKAEKKKINAARKKSSKENNEAENFLVVSPNEKSEEEKKYIKKKFDTLVESELRAYVAKEIFEADKMKESNSVSSAFFKTVVEVFAEIIEKEPTKRKELTSAGPLDMIYLFENMKNKTNAEEAIKTYFMEEGVFLR